MTSSLGNAKMESLKDKIEAVVVKKKEKVEVKSKKK